MRARTKKNLTVAACYAGVLILGMFLGPKFSRENGNTRNGGFLPVASEGREKVNKILQIISEKYVDPVKADSLQNLAIQDILKKLDPHSAYLPPQDALVMHEDLEGSFNGIGIEYYFVNANLYITGVTTGGPADKAGIKRGDEIVIINGKTIANSNITNKALVELIRGKRGSTLDVTVKRDGELKKLNVVRDMITISSIDVAYMLNSQTGYIKISKFGSRTDEDFAHALENLQRGGMKNLVLDLRENGGGYFTAATALADQFLPDKKLIVYTQGEHEPRTDYLATADGKFEQGGLAILIDENTASASEVVVGAVQDLDRGTIVGRRSFGKGLVQEQFDFGDGSAMNLTIARYYTPSGRSIQRSYKKGSDAYYQEVGNRYRNGELSSTGRYADSLYDKNKVFKTAAGRPMYGGGGIMPDIYVPVDTSGYTNLYYELLTKGVLNNFVFTTLVKPGATPAPLNALVRGYRITDDQFNTLFAQAKARGIKAELPEINLTKPVLDLELRALLARFYFGDEGYYRVINSTDKVLSRSVQIFNDDKTARNVLSEKQAGSGKN